MASKIPFRMPYDYKFGRFTPENASTPTGSPMQNEYSYKIDEYGRKILKKTGETDLYARIQESLEETKIENILKRVTMGDTSVLRPDGIYADLTEMPSNLIEARQAMQNLENIWGSLDNDIKRKYNFDVEEFIGASGSDSWLRDMGLLADKIEEPITETKKEEVTQDE